MFCKVAQLMRFFGAYSSPYQKKGLINAVFVGPADFLYFCSTTVLLLYYYSTSPLPPPPTGGSRRETNPAALPNVNFVWVFCFWLLYVLLFAVVSGIYLCIQRHGFEFGVGARARDWVRDFIKG